MQNRKDRPVAIGVIGLASLFKKLKYSWEDVKARELNKKIFANIYYAALEESCELARIYGPYEGYEGSPVSKGILQYDMWNVEPCADLDWKSLKEKIQRYGIRNSLLVGPMPTASTSQCVKTGYSEGPFPDESNLTLRATTKGSFIYVEREMAEMLLERGLWNKDLLKEIQANNGSVQSIAGFPEEIKKIYKTAFEYSYKTIIDHAVDHSPYINQSQSMNNYVPSQDPEKMILQLFDSHLRSWRRGLKTVYYTRSISTSRALNLKIGKSNKSNNDEKLIGLCTSKVCESCAV